MSAGIIYTVLDLETTGLKPDRDRIIDFAAIKLQDGKEIARLEQLIDPRVPIQPIITTITGIRDEDVADAPTWEAFQKEAADFIKDTIIVGHNIDFDVQFLREHGIEIDADQTLDTLNLSSILLPKQSSYSLEVLCRELGFVCVSTHRAMPDVEATIILFQRLLKELESLPTDTLVRMNKLCGRSSWPGKNLIVKALAESHTTQQATPRKETSRPDNKLDSESSVKKLPSKITPKMIREIFGEHGKFATTIPGWKSRAGQIQMAQDVFLAINEQKNAMIEAGTGIGKTLAYLVPSLLWALKNGEKIVISTNTINLQEQLIQKDIPLLANLMRAGFGGNGSFRGAVIKGQSNYLCMIKWQAWSAKERLTKDELMFALKITNWLRITEHGDKQEIHLGPSEQSLWSKIAASESGTESTGCNNHPDCFLNKALAIAKEAHLIVTNHALIVRDSLHPGRLIPPYKVLIVDEAHQFENAATHCYGRKITMEKSLALINTAIERFKFMGKKNQASLFSSGKVIEDLQQFIPLLENLHRKTEILFGLFGMLIERYKDRSHSFRPQLLVSKQIRNSETWQKIQGATQNCEILFGQIHEGAKQINDLQSNDSLEMAPDSLLLIDTLDELIFNVRDMLDCVNDILSLDETLISWLYLSEQETVCINTAPLKIADLLNEHIYKNHISTIFISTTLTIGGSFDYCVGQFGASKNWIFSDIPSYFDYKKSALLIIPQRLPNPSSPGAQKQLAKIIETAIITMRGRTLALFTSYSSLETVYNLIAPHLKDLGIKLLGQGISGGRGKIFKTFMSEPEKHAILGTGSFWEGVDIPGDDLSCVIINKLPFDVPSDPIFKSRSALFAEPFNDYAVPRAILKFKQGFGRLIRNEIDRGIVILLDRRLETTDYGRVFLDSLPEISIVQPEQDKLGSSIGNFLGLNLDSKMAGSLDSKSD